MKQYIFTFFLPGYGYDAHEVGAETLGQAYEAFNEAYPSSTGTLLINVTCLGS